MTAENQKMSPRFSNANPHADAAYRMIRLDGGEFGVEVTIPETNPTTVGAFASEAAAEDWIAQHRVQVQSLADFDDPGTSGSSGRTRILEGRETL